MTQQPEPAQDDWTSTANPGRDWADEYPKITRLFQVYVIDQPEESWADVVRDYRERGEKPLQFQGVADELDRLSMNADDCAGYLRDVLGIRQNPTTAYRTICNTYNELVLGDDSAANLHKGIVRVRNAPSWVPDLDADDDAAVITSRDLYSMQLKATVPVLPGRWGQIPIISYIASLAVLVLIGVLITMLLPYPVISEIGSMAILIGLIGLLIFALLMTAFRRLLLHGDGDEDDDEETATAAEPQRKKPGRLRRLFGGK